MTDNASRIESFFSGLFVDFWRDAMPVAQTRQEATFLEEQLVLQPSARVLDVPCGTGRHSREMAGRGYDMTAVDLSSESLAQARILANGENLAVKFEHRDMSDLPWPGFFHSAFSMGNSFGYIGDEHDRPFLAAVAGALKSGGRFALDYGAVAEALFPSFQERTWIRIGDTLFLREGRYDPAAGRIETTYTLLRSGKLESKPWTQRVYTYRQIQELFTAAGFTDLRPYSSLNKDAFTLGSRQLLLIATKAS